jgi:hypothetical protein
MTDERPDRDDELADEELDEQEAAPLPDREVMSTLRPPLIYEPIDPLPPEIE